MLIISVVNGIVKLLLRGRGKDFVIVEVKVIFRVVKYIFVVVVKNLNVEK